MTPNVDLLKSQLASIEAQPYAMPRVLNVELLTATMAAIEAHPERHNQMDWIAAADRCGTTMCFGGWAAVLSGQPEPDDWDVINGGAWFVGNLHVGDYAAYVLGLSKSQADALLYDAQSIEAVREAVAGILAGEIQ